MTWDPLDLAAHVQAAQDSLQTLEVAVLQGIQDILEAWAAQGKLETREPEAV